MGIGTGFRIPGGLFLFITPSIDNMAYYVV